MAVACSQVRMKGPPAAGAPNNAKASEGACALRLIDVALGGLQLFVLLAWPPCEPQVWPQEPYAQRDEQQVLRQDGQQGPCVQQDGPQALQQASQRDEPLDGQRGGLQVLRQVWRLGVRQVGRQRASLRV